MEIDNTVSSTPWSDIINKYREKGEKDRPFNRRMGVSHVSIQAWRKGVIPKLEIINRIRAKLGMSDEDYSNLVWYCHKIIPATASLIGQDKFTANLDARLLPLTHFCRRLFHLKPQKQHPETFIRNFGFTVDRWQTLMKANKPLLEMEEIYALVKNPAFAEDPDLLEWVLRGEEEKKPAELNNKKPTHTKQQEQVNNHVD